MLDNSKYIRLKETLVMVLSFLIPFISLIIIFSVNKISLFSKDGYTITMIDMQSQYLSYMRSYRNILLDGGSLIYTTEKALGGDYLSIFTFYLSSPFNLFVVFFKEDSIPLFFLWTNILRMSLGSFFFYLLTRFSSDTFKYRRLIFSVGYGIISYSLIYLSNFMWLDGVMILPMIALGIIFLKNKKHYWLYPVALAYGLMSSWYIGFMLSIFSVLFFIYIFIKDFSIEDRREIFSLLIRYTLFSLIGGFLASTYWLTAFLHLSGTKGTTLLPTFKEFSIPVLISGFLENNYTSHNLITQYNSYYSMFVGIVPLVFTSTFFFNNKYKLQDRLALLSVFLFYLLMSSNTVTTALLHGGREPTWFPGRYSFIMGFLALYAGYLSMENIEEHHPLIYVSPFVLGVVVTIIMKFMPHSERMIYYPISVPSLIIYFVTAGLALTISLFNYLSKDKELRIKKYIPYLLSFFLILECVSLARGSDNIIKTNIEEHQYQEYEDYLEDDAYTSSINKIKEYDDSFYRMETTFNRPGNYNQINNNPMFYSYNGLSNFSSSGKKDVESYLAKLGYHYNGFFTKFSGGSTYSISSLLGIKYVLDDEGNNTSDRIYPYYLEDNYLIDTLDIEDNKLTYYKNTKSSPLGFTINKLSNTFIGEGYKSESGNTYWLDKFKYQNKIFKDLLGDEINNEDIFKPLEITSVSTTLDYTEDEFGIRTYHNVPHYGRVTIEFNSPNEDYPLYFSEKDYKSDISYMLDNKRIECNTYWNKGIFSFKETASHKHKLEIVFNKNFDSISIRPELYYEDLSIAEHYLSKSIDNGFILDNISNSVFNKKYNGKINITNNNKDFLFTLPKESGIEVKVDGKYVETYTRWNIFTAIDLSSFEVGEHSISIIYQDNYLLISTPIFLIALLSITPLCIFYNRVEEKIVSNYKKRKETND